MNIFNKMFILKELSSYSLVSTFRKISNRICSEYVPRSPSIPHPDRQENAWIAENRIPI